jgi:hypothetical protein
MTTMVDVLILFPASVNTSEVDDFIGRFVPVVKEARGLRSVRISAGDLMSPEPVRHSPG